MPFDFGSMNFGSLNKKRNPYQNINFGPADEDEVPQQSMSQPNRLRYEDFAQPALNRYLQHSSSMPNPAQYGPSKWRRVLAGLTGGLEGARTSNPMAAYGAAEHINRQPYHRALEQWDIQGRGLEGSAKLEGAQQSQRMKYLEYLQDAEDKDLDREVKITQAETSRFNSETSRMRAEFDKKIRTAGNQNTVDRLIAQKEQWEKTNRAEERRISIAQQNATTNASRAGAYKNYMSRLGLDKPETPQQLGSRRRIVEAEVLNMHPEWLGPGGEIQNEFRPAYENAIQERLRRNIRGSINLPGIYDEQDEENEEWIEEP